MAVFDRLLRNLILLILSLSVELISANDILGCGGFVKSHANLDFSKIEIGLYTKAGTLKERTECAPTNGYYFLPLYEKGEYVLKVHPPAGWSFEPARVALTVDGVSDPCSSGQDINFAFNGFGITGKVITKGQTEGPSGIAVQLINEEGETRDTVTAVGGEFHFTPVIPGKYTLKASHQKWKLDPSQAVVQVKEGNTALPIGVLAVKGYDVRGSVVSFGSPIAGVYVLLYSKEENPKFRVEGCNTALLQGVPDAPICHSITDAAGEFSFGLVPAGEYKLLALAKNPGQSVVSFNIKPESVPFSVRHDSQYIKNAFEVTGFNIVGYAETGAGTGVAGARVLLDGRPVATADAAGRFALPSLQPATYTLTFQHEHCEFDALSLPVTSSGPAGDVRAKAARWRVCGAVTSHDGTTRKDVLLTNERDSKYVRRVTPDKDGKWCTFVPSGVYNAKVDVSDAEQREGLQFYPLTQRVSVAHNSVSGISFSQLKAQVSGRVDCGADPESKKACEGLQVTLRPLSPDGGYVGQHLVTEAINGAYTFSNVLPGSVEVSVPATRLCWVESRLTAAVHTEKATLPAFRLKGYAITIRLSHKAQVEYTSSSGAGAWSVPAGQSSVCVPRAERVQLTPKGCHRFRPASASVLVGSDTQETVVFEAISHAMLIRVLSPEAADDVTLSINEDSQTARPVGPLVPLKQPGGGYAFEHILFMAEGSVAVVSASSSSLLFSPLGPQQLVGGGECREEPPALTLRAVRGLTLQGRLRPPVSDVRITLTSDDLQLTQTTSADGTYRFGPLDSTKHYTIVASKESYEFSTPDANGDIVARKLAEITVELTDAATGEPLQNALVSVSGGSFRRNAVSSGGKLRVPALSPDDYYVKPNVKEFRFEPPHAIVAVKEGQTHHVHFKGVRVAWSCVGTVSSLGGAGWPSAVVQAWPTPSAAAGAPCAPEEATTELDGSFRIRGLVPKCQYALQLKGGEGAKELRLVGKGPIIVEVKDNKDIEDIRLIAIQPTPTTDASVLVRTPSIDHYKSLRLQLALDASPSTPVYSAKLDPAGYTQQNNPGLMYVLPRLPADNKTYALSLTAALSKSMYNFDEQVQYFVSDGHFKHFDFDFLPEVKSVEQELRQTSFLVIPLLFAVGFAYLRRDQLLAAAKDCAGRLADAQARRGRGERNERSDRPLLDKASIEHIVSTVNAAGKKPPKKKAQ